jgi:MIP family channel proteins
MANPKVFVAEFIGTFALVLVGSIAGLYQEGLLVVALAHGLTLAVFAFAYGHISGAHINPAVTLGHAANGTIKWSDAAVYWAAQFSGAALAAFLLRMVLNLLNPDAVAGLATIGELTVKHPYYAMGVEALLTFFLVNAVLHTTVGGKAGLSAGWAMGLAYTIAILAGRPLTGASLNPARTFGPAIFTKAFNGETPDFQNPMLYLIYFVGPFIGAILAVLVYQFMSTETVSVEENEDEDEIEEVIVEEVVVIEEKPKRKTAARKSTKK